MEPSVRSLYDPRIDQIRAIGILLVAAVHFFHPFYKTFLDEHLSVLASLIHNGHFGVSLFFFLSGYILSRLAANGGKGINYKQFIFNRFLRLYPLWLTCVLIVAFTNKLKGADVLALLLLFTQDLPPSAFNIAWSIQTEMYLYLTFPFVFTFVKTWKNLFCLSLFCFLIRLGLFALDGGTLRDLSYSSLFGALPVFAVGVYFGSSGFVIGKKYRFIVLALSILTAFGAAYLIDMLGGFLSHGSKILWLFYPELMVSIAAPFVLSYLSYNPQGAASSFATLLGKISYSAYIWHIFVLSFFISTRGLLGLDEINPALQFVAYVAAVFGFALLSYEVIEKPFLQYRKAYT